MLQRQDVLLGRTISCVLADFARLHGQAEREEEMRLKIIAGNLAVLVFLGLVVYLYGSKVLSSDLNARLDSEVAADAELLEQSWRIEAMDLLAQVTSRTEGSDAAQALRGLDDLGRRRAAHAFANDVSRWFGDPARGRVGRPDIVAVTDVAGELLARDQNPNQDVGRSIVAEVPALRDVLSGSDMSGKWRYGSKLLRVAMSPIRNDAGGVIGALVVGYDVSNGVAERHANLLGHEVAFVDGDQVYSASVSVDSAQSIKPDNFGAYTRRQAGEEEYAIASGTLGEGNDALRFMVFTAVSEYLSPLSALNMILILFGIAAFLMIAYGFVVGGMLSDPIEKMEATILNTINGNDSDRVDIEGGEYGGLAYRINQLIAFSIEGRVSNADWGDAASLGASDPPDTSDEAATQALASEDQASYEARLYDEYVAAKQSVGEDVSNIPKDRFLARLSKNAEKLKAKHGCRIVRFQVQQNGNQVILRPVIIR